MGYFPQWTSVQERFVEIFARVQKSAEYPRYARVSALPYQMIHDDSIIDELPKLLELQGVGHGRPIEVPEKFHAAVLEFLGGVKQ
jgi:pimeloyl-ACP methyl ester carboxylesterase